MLFVQDDMMEVGRRTRLMGLGKMGGTGLRDRWETKGKQAETASSKADRVVLRTTGDKKLGNNIMFLVPPKPSRHSSINFLSLGLGS
jgi:hypothetical protein